MTLPEMLVEDILPLLRDFQVKRMFEDIAFSYDFQTSFLSLGRDIQWRQDPGRFFPCAARELGP